MKRNLFAPDYPIGVYQFSLNGWALVKVFMVWSDAEEWMTKHCPNGLIQFRW